MAKAVFQNCTAAAVIFIVYFEKYVVVVVARSDSKHTWRRRCRGLMTCFGDKVQGSTIVRETRCSCFVFSRVFFCFCFFSCWLVCPGNIELDNILLWKRQGCVFFLFFISPD